MNFSKQFSKNEIATTIAIIFHSIGLIGVLFFNKDFFIKATPFNLLLSFILLIYTQQQKNKSFYIFLIAIFCIGILVEIIGVNTGLLFGTYSYGNVLGIKVKNVPLLIGINWFIITYCCSVSMHTLMQKAIVKMQNANDATPKTLRTIALIVDNATLAVFFDWVLEPVAINLGFWSWAKAEIPMFNYVCWFFVSALLASIFQVCNFNKQNKFAIHLLLIQLMFFLLLRTFL